MLTSACKTEHLLVATYSMFLQNLFLILSIEKFLRAPCEEHLQTASSKNVFMKLRKIKIFS